MVSEKINILIYIPYLTQESGGVRQYAVNLISQLKDLPDEYQIYIYQKADDPEVLAVQSSKQLKNISTFRWKLSYRIGSTIKGVLKKILNTYSSNTLYNFYSNLKLLWLIKRNKISIVHCPYQFIPKIKGVKLITTMHDVQELHFPEFFSPAERAYRAVNYFDYISRADAVIVSYEHVKNDLIKYFQVPESSVYVALLNMNNLWFNKFSSEDCVDIKNYNLPEKYLLFPANTWVHKNHTKLIEAIFQLKNAGNESVNLVFTGHKSDYYKTLAQQIDLLGLNSQIYFLGVVDEVTLYSLYHACTGVVIPTLYEAGSFPLMESILMDIPVICSNVTSLPETIDNPEFVFDPNDVDEIAKKVLSLYKSEAFRERSRENSRRVKSRIINTGTEKVFSECYKNLISH